MLFKTSLATSPPYPAFHVWQWQWNFYFDSLHFSGGFSGARAGQLRQAGEVSRNLPAGGWPAWPDPARSPGWADPPTHHPPHLLDHNVCFHYDRELARHAQSVRSVLEAMNDGGHLGEEILKCRLFIFFLIFVKVAPFVLIGSKLKVIWENTGNTHIGLGSGNNSGSKQYLKVRQT